MGSNLPKDLLNAERAKLQPIEGVYQRKSFDFDTFRSHDDDEQWQKVHIRIHQARIECKYNDEVEIIKINSEFLVISQSSSLQEIVVAIMKEHKIWKIRSGSIRDFIDLSACLSLSKIPTWSVSPVCQVCSNEFSFGKKRHHCRSCGKSICHKCVVIRDFDFESFSKLNKVCGSCLILIDSQISVIKEIHRNEIIRGDGSSRSLIIPALSRKS